MDSVDYCIVDINRSLCNSLSEGYTYRDVQYTWTHGNGKSIKMSPDMRMAMFDLIGSPHEITNLSHAQCEY